MAKYLVKEQGCEPFFSNQFNVENNYMLGMIVYDIFNEIYYDGESWKNIECYLEMDKK